MKRQIYDFDIRELVNQLKADMGILPYSDLEQPEKFGNMTMSMVEENINDFQEVLLDKLGLAEKKSTTSDKEKKS
jgi:hypothetical protein